VWLFEKEICVLKASEGLSFPEARKRVVLMKGMSTIAGPRPGTTFAAVTSAAPPKKLTATVATQTIATASVNIQSTRKPPGRQDLRPPEIKTTNPPIIRQGAGIVRLSGQQKTASTNDTSGSTPGSPRPTEGSQKRGAASPAAPSGNIGDGKRKKSGSKDSLNDITMGDPDKSVGFRHPSKN
jgi:hypothetical protein